MKKATQQTYITVGHIRMNNILENTLRLSVHEHLSGVIPSHAMYSSCTGLFGAQEFGLFCLVHHGAVDI